MNCKSKPNDPDQVEKECKSSTCFCPLVTDNWLALHFVVDPNTLAEGPPFSSFAASPESHLVDFTVSFTEGHHRAIIVKGLATDVHFALQKSSLKCQTRASGQFIMVKRKSTTSSLWRVG